MSARCAPRLGAVGSFLGTSAFLILSIIFAKPRLRASRISINPLSLQSVIVEVFEPVALVLSILVSFNSKFSSK